MEYNKDEALRAKEIAEKKFIARDLAGAKKFALKAEKLYPSLEGLSQTMAVLDVHIAAENKANGQMDWYAILQVDLVAEETLIKKQYKRLALMLHPDKNKAAGAEEAFKLIGEAWGILSDRDSRSRYDQTRSSGNGHSQGKKRQRKERNPNRPSAMARKGATDTFWTSCPFCKTRYEFSRKYANLYILCPLCKQAFQAWEAAGAAPNASAQQQQGMHRRSPPPPPPPPPRPPSDADNDVLGNGEKAPSNGQGKENELPKRAGSQGNGRSEGSRKEHEVPPKKNLSKRLKEEKFDRSAFDRLFAGVGRGSKKAGDTAKVGAN